MVDQLVERTCRYETDICNLDSKKLTEEKRTQLAQTIEASKDWVGWAVYVISPQDISTNMHKR